MIRATITYECGGCDATHTTEPIRMTAHSQPVNYGSWEQVWAAGASEDHADAYKDRAGNE